MISMITAKKILGIIWIVGFIFPFLLLIIMTNNDTLQDKTGAWGWFLPTMLPTVSLIVAVFVSDALHPDQQETRVGRFIFGLALAFSIIYIGLVGLVTLDIPRSTSPMKLTELLKNSNVYLGPFQGLLTAVLGVFFVSRNNAEAAH